MSPLLLLQLLGPLLSGVASRATAVPVTQQPAIDPSVLAALVAAAQTPPPPLPEVKLPRSAAVVAAIVVIGFFALLAAISGLLLFGDSERFSAALAVLCVGFGVLSSKFGTVVDFLFGSSWGSRTKDARPPAEPAWPPVVLPPAVEPAPPVIAPVGPVEPTEPVITIRGKVSTFGGPADHGSRDPDEGLALYEEEQASKRPDLFLTVGPGLFRRLNPAAYYLAARWDYGKTPKAWLRSHKVTVTAKGKSIEASPVDWGPHVNTGRDLDLSPGAAAALGLDTDDTAVAYVPMPGSVALSQDRPGGPSWLSRAVAMRGLYEKEGDADNPAILEMARVCGGQIAAAYHHDSIAWCALFVNYCLIASKYPGNDSLWALDFGKYGRKLTGPAVGAIASMKRDGGGHVVFVLGKTASGKIVGVGGNMSDAVRDDVYDPERIVSYNYPEDAPIPLNAGVTMTDLSALPIVTPAPFEKKDIGLS